MLPLNLGYYCADSTNSTADGPEYAECKLMVQDKQKAEEFKRTWLSVVGALGAFFVIFMGILILFATFPFILELHTFHPFLQSCKIFITCLHLNAFQYAQKLHVQFASTYT